MTSNVGSSAIAKGRHGSIGFILDDDEEEASYAGMKAMVVEELKNYFRPELLNRIDEIVIFRQLEKAQVSHFLFLSTELSGTKNQIKIHKIQNLQLRFYR